MVAVKHHAAVLLALASCVQESDTSGKESAESDPLYSVATSEPINAVALDLGMDDEYSHLGHDSVCVLIADGTVRCTDDIEAPGADALFSTLSVSADGGCGLLAAGGAACWGELATLVTHDLSDVTSISVLPTAGDADREVCGVTEVGSYWCDGDQATIESADETWTEVSTGWTGAGLRAADGGLWWLQYPGSGGETYHINADIEAEVAGFSANSSVNVVFVTADGVAYQAGVYGFVSTPSEVAENVELIEVDPVGAVECWVDDKGAPGVDWLASDAAAFTEAAAGLTLVDIACTLGVDAWAVTDDGRVVNITSDLDVTTMPF